MKKRLLTRVYKKRGAVLLMALLILFIITVVSSSLASRAYFQIVLLSNRNDDTQLDFFNKAVFKWVEALLWEDQKHAKTTTLDDAWATPLSHFEIEGGYVTGQIYDAQSMWNINNLFSFGRVDSVELGTFKKLLQILHLPSDLASNAVKAMTELAQIEGLSIHSFRLVDLSQLEVAPGFSESVIQTLRSYVIALPTATMVNVNTASPEVLAAMMPLMDMRSIQQIILHRKKMPFLTQSDLKQFIEKISPPSASNMSGHLSLNSSYFLLDGFSQRNDVRSPIYVLFRRFSHYSPIVVWFKRSY